jgi:hypothetical protein
MRLIGRILALASGPGAEVTGLAPEDPPTGRGFDPEATARIHALPSRIHTECYAPLSPRHPGSTLIARAITRIAMASDTTASIIIVIFAYGRRGKVSVGLNAVAFVKERYR